MAKRKHELLTDAERELLIGIPKDRDHLARLYTFEPADIAIIGTRRHQRNWLGAALQLALLRHPGVSLAQFLQDRHEVPAELQAFVAAQLGLVPGVLDDYAAREQTMTDHARELAIRLGMRAPVRSDIALMIDAAAKAAWTTDKGSTVAAGVIAGLRGAGILLPSISTIERTGIAGRARARKQAAHALVSALTAEQILLLDTLFDEAGADNVSRLAWLKSIPVAAKPDHIRQILERLKFVRAIGIPAAAAGSVHVERYRQFVREGRTSATYMIERYATARRHATLVAFLIDIEERLTDAAIEMADKLIGGVFTRARNAQARNFAATSRDVGRLMTIFGRTIDALCQNGIARDRGSDGGADNRDPRDRARDRTAHDDDELAQSITTMPGVGSLTASAVTATISDPSQFRSGREFAAWIGLVPRQNSTGGKATLGRISKAGNHYLRRLLVIGASAVLRHAKRKLTEDQRWALQLLERKPPKLAAVALANKMARVI